MEIDTNEAKKLLSQIKKFQRIRRCFHYEQEKCSENIIDAHSISMSSNMKLIKGIISKNEKVYTLSERILDNTKTERFLEDIGWTKASTFNGFCGEHDRTTFLPIEDNHLFEIEKLEHLFLQSYRSFALGYHKKLEYCKIFTHDSPILEQLEKSIDLLESNSDRFEKMVKMPLFSWFENIYSDLMKKLNDLKEQLSQGNNFAVLDFLEEYKLKINYLLKEKIYGGLKFFVEVKKGTFPLASANTFFPKLLGGVVIQPSDPNRPANFPIILSILPDQYQRTIIIFACFEHDENGKLYLETLEKIRSQNINSLDQVVSKIVLQETDNTFFSPQYWEKLSDSEKNEFQKQLNESEYYNLLSYKPLQSGINLFDERFLLKV